MGGPARRLLREPAARRLVVGCGVLAAAVTALLVVQWTAVARFVTAVVADGADPASLTVLLAVALGAWAVRALLVASRDALAARTSSRVRRDVRAALARKLVRLGPGFASGERAGELATTATGGVAALDGYLARSLPGTVWAGVVPPLVMVVVLVLDPPSGLILLLTGPLLLVFLWLVGTRAAEQSRRRWADLGRLGALLVDTVRVLPTLVAHGRARSSTAWLAGVSDAYRVSTMRVLRTAFLSGFVLELGATLCTALVAVTVGVRLFEGHLELGRALLVLLLVPEFFAPLRSLGADHHASIEARPALERIGALLDVPEPERGTRPAPVGAPHLRLRGVRVVHEGRTVLDGLDLDLPAGSRTALVGASGAGKTTVVRLLLGLAVPDAGEVLVDGVPLGELDPDAWRSRIAHVPERPWLLPGTIADNVRLGRPGASEADVRGALLRAGAADVLARLPEGIATVVGEDGARLSGGERLRVALARAIIADAPVVLLDEPTSQLDPATEVAVLVALSELSRGRTVLTITHRTAPLAGIDRVVDLVDGRALAREVR